MPGPFPPLVQADACLAAIVESSDDAIISKTLEGVITTWNKAAERILGYTAQEMIGRSILTLIPPDRADEEQLIIARIRSGQRVEHYETVRRRRDGTLIDVSLTISPIKDARDRIIGASKILRDITEQKRLRESVGRLRLAIESAPNGMLMVDEHGTIVMVNAQVERLFGYGRDELLGSAATVVLPALFDDAPQVAPTRAAGGTAREVSVHRKDGTQIPVEVSLNRADTAEGSFVLAAVVDITARKRAEAAAKKSAAQLRLVVEAAPNGMVMVDERGAIVMVNAQMERLFGYTRAEMIGRKIEMLLPQRFRDTHRAQRKDFLQSPETRAMGHGRHLYGRRKDGSEFPVEVGLNPAETPDGSFVLAAVIDITQRKRMEQELADAHAALSKHARDLEATVAERTAHLQHTIAELEGVSYSLSHDMRAPLRAMQGFSQIVLSEAGERLDDNEKDLRRRTINAASRLDRLIQDVLTYTRVSRQAVELTAVDLEPLLNQIIDERPELQAPKADITLVTPLARVRGHEASLTQCITNLLDNAVKFVAAGQQPQIRIWTEPAGSRVRLWFEDNGIGIPKEAQGRLFGIFQRIHDDKTYPGTGIGLAIVRKAVERMGGSVSVESTPGKGSRFGVELERDGER
jgi:PAS domain S-box-containing protein